MLDRVSRPLLKDPKSPSQSPPLLPFSHSSFPLPAPPTSTHFRGGNLKDPHGGQSACKVAALSRRACVTDGTHSNFSTIPFYCGSCNKSCLVTKCPIKRELTQKERCEREGGKNTMNTASRTKCLDNEHQRHNNLC